MRREKQLSIRMLVCLLGGILLCGTFSLAHAEYPEEVEAYAESYAADEAAEERRFDEQSIIIPIHIQISIANSIAIAFRALGNAVAVFNSTAVTGSWSQKAALARSIAKTSSLLGNLLAIAKSRSIARGCEARSIAKSLAHANTSLGNFPAIAHAFGGTGVSKVARLLATAQSAIRRATAMLTRYTGGCR